MKLKDAKAGMFIRYIGSYFPEEKNTIFVILEKISLDNKQIACTPFGKLSIVPYQFYPENCKKISEGEAKLLLLSQ